MTSSPTLRRRRLARHLRELRESQGYTAEDVAAEAKRLTGKPRGWSVSKLVRLEKAEWKRLRLDDVRVLLDIYQVTSEEEREAYLTLTAESNQRGWWTTFGDALGSGQFVGLETEATSIRTYQSMVVPGLLQTEEYARAMIAARGIIDQSDITRRVEARMFRKNVFLRSNPPTLWAIIDEAALLRIPSGLSSQLEHLLEASERGNIGIQVMPLARGLHAAMTGQLVIMDFAPPEPPVVYLEVMSEELYLEKPEQITHYQHIYDHAQAEALSVIESRECIRAILTSRKDN